MSYRVSLVVWQLGWVDLDLHDSPGWMAAIVVTNCQSRMVEHLKSESTQPNCQTTSPTLSSAKFMQPPLLRMRLDQAFALL